MNATREVAVRVVMENTEKLGRCFLSDLAAAIAANAALHLREMVMVAELVLVFFCGLGKRKAKKSENVA